jgi:hypothetical protein
MAGGLFQDFNPFKRVATNQAGMVGKSVARGSLIAFHYPISYAAPPNEIHDPYPLVIITDIWPKHTRGINLHYLTFPYIKNILQGNCGNKSYSYFHVKGDAYIAQAFRMYYRIGMSQVKLMDCDFLLNLLGGIKSWSESEIEAVKQQIRQQVQKQLQTKADELTKASQQPQQQKFTSPQNRQINQKAADIHTALQGGVTRGLERPATMNPPEPNQGQPNQPNVPEEG